jgi:hypothetical protein
LPLGKIHEQHAHESTALVVSDEEQLDHPAELARRNYESWGVASLKKYIEVEQHLVDWLKRTGLHLQLRSVFERRV